MFRIVLLSAALAVPSAQIAVPASPLPMQAQTPAASSDISGKWHFVFQTDGGDRENDAEFKLDGDQVSGKWNKTDVKGTFKEGELNLAFPYNSDEAGMTATLKMKGKLTEGKLVGNWEFADYTGSFVATRQ